MTDWSRFRIIAVNQAAAPEAKGVRRNRCRFILPNDEGTRTRFHRMNRFIAGTVDTRHKTYIVLYTTFSC